MNEVIIRKGRQEDIPQVMALVKELAEYERALHEVTNTVEQMTEDGYGKNPLFGLIVAVSESTIVGIALFYYRYSTWKGKMMYLEDIVVTSALRGSGIGKKLFEACVDIALETHCKGLCWQVLDWNTPAINFYKKYDSNLDAEWINGKLTRSQLEEIQMKKDPTA